MYAIPSAKDAQAIDQTGPDPPALWLCGVCFLLGVWVPYLIYLALVMALLLDWLNRESAGLLELVMLFGQLTAFACVPIVASVQASIRLNSSWSSCVACFAGIGSGAFALFGFMQLASTPWTLPQADLGVTVAIVSGTAAAESLGLVSGIASLVISYYLFTTSVCHGALSVQINRWRPPKDPFLDLLNRQHLARYAFQSHTG